MQGGFTFSKSGFYLNDPLVPFPLNGHSTKEEKGQKKKKGRNGEGGHQGKMCFHVEEACHLLIVRKVLNKKDLGAAESCLFQCGWVGLLFSREAGQDSAREVCNYLKLLWGFFQ